MNAIDFIKQHGVEKAREVITKDQFVADISLVTPSGNLIYYKEVKGSFPEVTDFGKVGLIADDYLMVELSDLKRLVESMERIERSGNLAGFHKWCDGDYSERDLQAIADYEAIHSFDIEKREFELGLAPDSDYVKGGEHV